MRIKGIGDAGDGFIEYELAVSPDGKELVSIYNVRGVKTIKGVGEALKKELLRRYPKREVRSTLVDVNAAKLLTEWARGYPHRSSEKNGEGLRKVVPALKFKGFDYELVAEPSRTGNSGSIQLVMRAVDSGRGSIRIKDPLDLDKMLLSSPHRPKDTRSAKR